MDDNTASEMRAPDGLLGAALRYIERGWWIFPAFVTVRRTGSGELKKRPQFPPSWEAASTNDPAMAHAWFGPMGLYREGVLCIDTGRSGLVVVDPDVAAGGMANWQAFRLKHGDCPETYRVITPSGGEHWFYAARPGETVTIDSSGKVAPDVDIRGTGGLVFAAPSDIRGYGPYRWVEGEPEPGDLPLVPRSVVTAMTPLRPPAAAVGSLAVGNAGSGSPGLGIATAPRMFSAEEAWEFVRGRAEEFGGLDPRREGLGRNQKLFELALVMAHFVGVFWDEASVHAQLVALAQRNGMAASHGVASVAATIRSAWGRQRDWVAVDRGAIAAPAVAAGGDQGGEVPSSQSGTDSVPDPVAALRAQFLDSEGLDALADPVPLVAGWLWRDTVGALIGPSGHGKSFSLIDISGAVGAGEPWHGIPTEKAGVWWIVGEGIHGARKRVRAWEKHHQRRLSGLRILPRPIQASGAEWHVLCQLAALERPGLVWLDTQARMTVGMEENSNTEMGVFVARMGDLRSASGGACVMAVHHTGHDVSRGRGASALYGAWDTEIMAAKSDAPGGGKLVTLKSTKSKDDGEPDPLELAMTVVEMGYLDSLGKQVTSVVLTQAGMSAIPGLGRVRAMGGRWDAMLEALPKSRLTIIDVFQNIFPAAGATKAAVKGECVKLGMRESRTFYRCWDDLIGRGVLIRYEGTERYNLASTFDAETAGQG